MAVLAGAVVLFSSTPAGATGFTDIGEDIVPRTDVAVKLDGYLRARAADLYNLDLDRGLTPSGQPLFPLPVGNPSAQAMTYADMRLRTDVAVYAPGGTVAVKARFDLLDNVAAGSDAQGVASSSASQLSPPRAFRVKRAYGEAVTPFGVISVGRIGSTWGLGMLTNGGDCADCNYGDAADRVALVTPLAGHIFALAYDLDQIGPFVAQQPGQTFLNLSPSADVRTVHRRLPPLQGRPLARSAAAPPARPPSSTAPTSRSAGRTTTSPRPTCPPRSPSPSRGRSSCRAATRPPRSTAGRASRTPCSASRPSGPPSSAGCNRRRSSRASSTTRRSRRRRWAARSRARSARRSRASAGDSTRGTRAATRPPASRAQFPVVGSAPAKPGDLNGPKANPPTHTTVDNFTFHPDYFVDRILFREIIGAVTGAVYARPHVRVGRHAHRPRCAPGQPRGDRVVGRLPGERAGRWQAAARRRASIPSLCVIARRATASASRFEYGVLFPMAGLDNPQQNLKAFPAQLARVRVMYRY